MNNGVEDGPMHEIEMKARVDDPSVYEKRLGKSVARLEFTDLVFDRAGSLHSSDRLLRIRKYPNKAVLTYKGPRLDSVAKKRPEIEVVVDDPDRMEDILKNLGYSQVLQASRKRDVYHFMGAEVVVDRFPEIGYFIEIEAQDVETIFRVADKLGIPQSDLTSKTYWEIFESQDKV